MTMLKFVVVIWGLFVSLQLAAYDGRYGWFVQKPPKQIIVCKTGGLDFCERMLLESLSGLAAQAVNEDRFDEMVWCETQKNLINRFFRVRLIVFVFLL